MEGFSREAATVESFQINYTEKAYCFSSNPDNLIAVVWKIYDQSRAIELLAYFLQLSVSRPPNYR